MSISSRSHVSRTWESVTKTKVCLNRRKRCFGAQYLSCLCLWVSHSARWQEILHHLKSVLNIDLHQDLWVLLFWVLNCCYLEHTPFGRVTFWSESTFTLFPIFLIMLLPPPAHWKPSGSIGSGHPWGKWGGGGSEVQLSACQALPRGHSGHCVQPHGAFFWDHLPVSGLRSRMGFMPDGHHEVLGYLMGSFPAVCRCITDMKRAMLETITVSWGYKQRYFGVLNSASFLFCFVAMARHYNIRSAFSMCHWCAAYIITASNLSLTSLLQYINVPFVVRDLPLPLTLIILDWLSF